MWSGSDRGGWSHDHHRFAVRNDLSGRLTQADVSLDLLLCSRREYEVGCDVADGGVDRDPVLMGWHGC
jgi:hypothetical protein